MSLLLDALKKAEAAKRREEEGGSEQPPPLPAPSAPRITPAHELELIDDEIAQAARFAGLDVPEPTPAPPSPTNAGGSEAARLLFDAKRSPARPPTLMWLLAASAVLLLVVGVWVVWQLNALEHGMQAPVASPSPPTTAPTPPFPALAASTGPISDAGVPATPDVQQPATAALPPAPSPAVESARFLSGQIAATEPPVASAAAAPPAPPIRITRNPPAIPQDVADGYAAFQSGQFDRARAAYEAALRSDPRNPDALHGLAALARRQNDEAQLRHLMRRIAEVDPTDTAARIALSDSTDPVVHEARLLDLIAAQPRSAEASFALGTLYASQARWREAQQAYFNAWTLAPDQPDHAYNLAVSLDHLRQPRLALQYYREAMARRGQHPAGFDADAVAGRIQSLLAHDEH